ncbi:MAG: transglutaminase family protein [Eubacterium sp.]|nr:transglutaminase family protein [Eubacterium sp.]MDD7208744.1 transglutaminase family protein [Lachnospiraceae bacterium]MDY5497771.1 transglutaminase family protein [Anaerobutyricum sp.]
MKRNHFVYRMCSDFSAPVTDHSFTLKCIPETNPCQKIILEKQDLKMPDWISSGRDSFGNFYLYGKEEKPHINFEVVIEGEADVERKRGYEWCGRIFPNCIYPTDLTLCNDKMIAFLSDCISKIKKKQRNFEDTVFFLMQEVYGFMEYVPGVTTVKTTAREAFSMKKGVCQDYAHILCGLYKKLGYPSCYVAGFMSGEGASHAWVSVCDPQTGLWYEIDPTNNKWADDGYLSVSYGADSSDCVMNRGLYRGFCTEEQKISVLVKER